MLREMPSLPVLSFFSLEADIYYAEELQLKEKYALFSTAKLLNEDEICKVFAAWREDGLLFEFSYQEMEAEKGASFEIFIDTRNIKTKHFITKFCHHFICNLDGGDNPVFREITRFRSDDRHDLAPLSSLHSSFVTEKKGRKRLRLFIEKEGLFGYDIENFPALGFTYKISRPGFKSQHFSVSSEQFVVEKCPDLWASLKVVKT